MESREREILGKERKGEVREGWFSLMARCWDHQISLWIGMVGWGCSLFKAGRQTPKTRGIIWVTLTNKNTIKWIKKQIHFILRLSIYLGCFKSRSRSRAWPHPVMLVLSAWLTAEGHLELQLFLGMFYLTYIFGNIKLRTFIIINIFSK